MIETSLSFFGFHWFFFFLSMLVNFILGIRKVHSNPWGVCVEKRNCENKALDQEHDDPEQGSNLIDCRTR